MSGIDYGMGRTNINPETGIRYGVIPAQKVDYWDEQAEANYGPPTCPKCGELLDGSTCECKTCDKVWEAEEAYPDSPLGWNFDMDGILAEQAGDSGDIFVVKSPFYTQTKLCSPCAPGAGHLSCPVEGGAKAYCFGHDWFEEEIAPYRVYRVDDDSLVPPPTTEGS